MAIDTFNKFMVGVQGENIAVLNPPRSNDLADRIAAQPRTTKGVVLISEADWPAVEAALRHSASPEREALADTLLACRGAIESLDADALGTADNGEMEWPVRDELLSNIDKAMAALSKPPISPSPRAPSKQAKAEAIAEVGSLVNEIIRDKQAREADSTPAGWHVRWGSQNGESGIEPYSVEADAKRAAENMRSYRSSETTAEVVPVYYDCVVPTANKLAVTLRMIAEGAADPATFAKQVLQQTGLWGHDKGVASREADSSAVPAAGREAFERWWIASGRITPERSDEKPEEYLNSFIQLAWVAWQARALSSGY